MLFLGYKSTNIIDGGWKGRVQPPPSLQKTIENPLDLGYKGNIEKEFILNEKNEILKEEISSEFKAVDEDVLNKIQFKRDCLSNFPKSKK